MALAITHALVAVFAVPPALSLGVGGDEGVAIYGGTEVEECGWPTAVSLAPGCTATLVHPEIILYAAHCGEVEEVNFGETFQAPARVVPVDYCKVNPAHISGGGPDDWAFCKLAEPVTDLDPTPPLLGCELDLLEVGAPVTIVGFGYAEDDGYGTKRAADTEILDVFLQSGMVQIGGGGKTVCYGDSGGPTFIQHPDGGWRAVAIASTVAGECGQAYGNHVLMRNAIAYTEAESGIDITPCTDAEGAWDPSPSCGGFATDPGAAGASWDEGCSQGAVTGSVESCGPAWDAPAPDEIPPWVAIVEPADGTVFEESEVTIAIGIEADAGDGWSVSGVRIRIAGEEQAVEDVEPPFLFSNVSFGKGTFELVAIAEDYYGLVGESAPVIIYVGEQPPAAESSGTETDTGDDGAESSGTDGGDEATGTDTEDSSATLESSDEAGCSCRTRGPGSAWLVMVVLALLRRRSRAGKIEGHVRLEGRPRSHGSTACAG